MANSWFPWRLFTLQACRLHIQQRSKLECLFSLFPIHSPIIVKQSHTFFPFLFLLFHVVQLYAINKGALLLTDRRLPSCFLVHMCAMCRHAHMPHNRVCIEMYVFALRCFPLSFHLLFPPAVYTLPPCCFSLLPPFCSMTNMWLL